MAKSPKLELTDSERLSLRQAKIFLRDIAAQDAKKLASATGLDINRCRELIVLAEFQTLDSVGLAAARCFILLGFHSLKELKKGDPVEMCERLEQSWDDRVDPCVEDTFRCAIAQVLDPKLPSKFRNWWAWMPYRGESTVAVSK